MKAKGAMAPEIFLDPTLLEQYKILYSNILLTANTCELERCIRNEHASSCYCALANFVSFGFACKQ